ncbi:hypothetical protein DVV91_10125 [Clostridium botulinum]|uniref:hypothetical protein n=1 Tax=Clostridium botulinum TaxID=1491 RepID=UPI001966F786|nr:hypothetical protein [Clostridium botulinum]MBN1074698.1 hypothetical protein [Clostridium botulinum]
MIKRLVVTECGQYNDKLQEDIKEDFKNCIKSFLEKYKDIDVRDLEFISHHELSYACSKLLLKQMNNVMREKGYNSSDEAKDVNMNITKE